MSPDPGIQRSGRVVLKASGAASPVYGTVIPSHDAVALGERWNCEGHRRRRMVEQDGRRVVTLCVARAVNRGW